MNFQQLRIIRETARRGFNLTEVAGALYTSQSGVSKHIKDLEDELGVELFVRRGKRLTGLTGPGEELLELVERLLLEAENIKRIADQYSQTDRGELTVVTTHMQARYALPPIVAKFKQTFPDVHLVLHQASPAETASMLLDGSADVGVATDALIDNPDLISFPFYSWHHAVIAPKGHPLEKVTPLTLEAIAEYPIITYNPGFTGRAGIDAAFASAGLSPDIVMAALDADVIKAYVELGLGVGIIASMAFDPTRDTKLTLLDSTPLFQKNTSRIALRRGRYLRGFVYRFIEFCSPELTEGLVRSETSPSGSNTSGE
ncbi:DNA-binding transcriptional activator of cysteine biosynthesis [Candidatus Filomicrobium marinum]|uniref:DNA-binding transcriptional activator of cysteine biosynthesis n=2 Tax=Filomicrobium TaxID=119044 RepID=A0A0D6JKS7_9HYPH|nr:MULTISPECIES: CysB family HTH-type transcriptional regulator [Filomicrobium]MCV0369018.1 CysB family HTH-type transcriptional regulator [Filomicrobium sp.]CFX63880.1 DNA-binding transcriptional activator of cysteine biosynthesis [Candidatus Filomicrobium marinum]CPR22568.1 DNA-binding transcriptional activator of cysteine biosynthesis [Candidatus Filomicrobium marinum]SDO79742.1 LysR family transcriptional regulator, cys regulon transcriptional activator [Filomicrobium insigne]